MKRFADTFYFLALLNPSDSAHSSATDCISFFVMQDRQIAHALTGDRHFEQAGFVAMLQ